MGRALLGLALAMGACTAVPVAAPPEAAPALAELERAVEPEWGLDDYEAPIVARLEAELTAAGGARRVLALFGDRQGVCWCLVAIDRGDRAELRRYGPATCCYRRGYLSRANMRWLAEELDTLDLADPGDITGSYRMGGTSHLVVDLDRARRRRRLARIDDNPIREGPRRAALGVLARLAALPLDEGWRYTAEVSERPGFRVITDAGAQGVCDTGWQLLVRAIDPRVERITDLPRARWHEVDADGTLGQRHARPELVPLDAFNVSRRVRDAELLPTGPTEVSFHVGRDEDAPVLWIAQPGQEPWRLAEGTYVDALLPAAEATWAVGVRAEGEGVRRLVRIAIGDGRVAATDLTAERLALLGALEPSGRSRGVAVRARNGERTTLHVVDGRTGDVTPLSAAAIAALPAEARSLGSARALPVARRRWGVGPTEGSEERELAVGWYDLVTLRFTPVMPLRPLDWRLVAYADPRGWVTDRYIYLVHAGHVLRFDRPRDPALPRRR